MKTNFKTIKKIMSSGKTGIGYESNISVGMKVKTLSGKHGVVIGPGFAGMPEVQLNGKKDTSCYAPSELEILQ